MAGELFAGSFSLRFEESFLDTIAQASGSVTPDPLLVLVPSNLVGIHLRRALALRMGGHLNVRFWTFVDLAQRLHRASPRSQGRVPFPDGAELLLLRERASALPESAYFAPIAKQRGFHRALRTTFHDLIDAGISEIPATSPKLRELGQLFSGHRKAYLDKFYSTADLLLEAGQATLPAARILGTDHLYCYGFYDFTGVQRRLLRYCAGSLELQAWVPVSEPAPPLLQATLKFFEGLGLKPRAIPIDTVSPEIGAISSPGEHAEVEETVRWLLNQVKGSSEPLHRVGILLRETDRYQSLFTEVLTRARIPFYAEGGITLDETSLGQSVERLFDLLSGDWRRETILQTLSLFPFQTPWTEAIGTFPDWDQWTRQAAVTRGRDSFLQRLRSTPRKDPRVELFTTFLAGWFADLSLLQATTWRDLAGTWVSFVKKYAAPSEETEALIDVLGRLSDMDATSIPVSTEALAEVLGDRIRSRRISHSVFGRDGVFVGSLVSARLIPFDRVILPGLSERAFPAPARPDPLLLDHERAQINRETGGELAMREDRLDEERVLFDLSCRQARTALLLSYPRLDLTRSRERLPSSFLSARSINHRPLLRWQSSSAERECIDERDWLSAVIGPQVVAHPETLAPWLYEGLALGRAVRSWVEERLGKNTFTPFDGIITVTDKAAILSRAFSATELSTFATCPYRYFLRYVAGLETYEDPDDVQQLRATDRGTVNHTILFRLFQTLKKEGLLPLRPERYAAAHAILQRVADEVFQETEQKLPLGPRLLWQTEKMFLLADLENLLKAEFDRSDLFQPVDFEIRFGMPAGSQEEGERSTDRPVEVRVGREQILLRGRIDRLDLSPDRKRARIVDYKTGAMDTVRNDRFSGGTNVQLPIYLSALSIIAPEVDLNSSEAILLATAYGEGARTVRWAGSVFQARRKEFEEILSTSSRYRRLGYFPPTPGDGQENCRSCDFTRICGSSIGRIFERKREDPMLAPIKALGEIE